MRRWKKTLENTQIMISREGNGSTTIVPAIHGYSEKEIEWFLNKLFEIGRFSYVGIGSLVPSVFNTKGAGGITNVIKILDFVREKMPDTKIHVFGVGSTLTMHLMFYAGADSVDSLGWRTKAAYGVISFQV
jgi:7-cyano-7-deazaguanine tRNA-ribosyltransferase